MNKIISNLKYIKPYDLLTPFIFIFVLPFSLILRIINKIKKRRVWLVCERKISASDNGYHFFKYMIKNHPEIITYYVIDKKCREYKKVEEFGNIIQWGSFKHWIYYLSDEYNISSQKDGNPSQAFFYVLHVMLNMFNNRIFLQHGVIMNDNKFLYYKETKFRKFVCGAKDEYDYIDKTFGYPQNTLIFTGLPRFDNLHDGTPNKKHILLIPTWRNWLGRETNRLHQKEEFSGTKYFKAFESLLNDDKLNSYLKEKDITLYFYPHFNMQKFISEFSINGEHIKLVDINNCDIQELLKDTSLMITDYSSIHMDFAYMKKPIVYYQFDYSDFREKQYGEGYFSYNTFGEVFDTKDDVVNKIIYYIDNNYKVEENFKSNMDKFFILHDEKNCERVYKELV